MKVPQVWSITTSGSMYGFPLISSKKIKKLLSKFRKQKGLVIPYGTDIEFIGYRSMVEGKLITPSDLISLLQNIISISDNQMILPSKYLEKHKPSDLGYMKTGSWSPDRRLDLWTEDEDNKKLERLCQEARWFFTHLPESEVTEDMWKHLLLAENSDGRGWDPIPERRLDCYDHACEAIKLAKDRYLNLYIEKGKK